MGLREPDPKGPVQILCEEIGFCFDRRLERTDVLVSFVRQLVLEVEERKHIAETIANATGRACDHAAAEEVLTLAREMLAATDAADLIARAQTVHDACDRLNPDDAYPTDHLIDMLSSCASAIRFGLGGPCSRHAAEAARHVWKKRYSVACFDRLTPGWMHEWARGKLIEALIDLITSNPKEPTP